MKIVKGNESGETAIVLHADLAVIVGGIVPDEDAEELKKIGVAAVFQPGAPLEAIVNFIRGAAPA